MWGVPSEELLASWRRTEELLERARRSLTNPDNDALADYHRFIEQNELGLAFDAPVDVAEEQRAPQTTWEALLGAATEIGVSVDDGIHGASRQRLEAHLTSGAEWFELQGLLNEWDPIGVYDPETHFPEDEYDCLYQPLLSRLRQAEGAHEITVFLETELRDHFGLDPRPSRPRDFALRLIEWYRSRS